MARGKPVLKSERDLAGIRAAAAVVEQALAAAAVLVRPGTRTAELDAAAEAVIVAAGGRSAFKGYQMGEDTDPFPGALCISVNDVVVHGFPSEYALQDGDIVTLDCGVELDGYFGDFAYTFPVGDVAPETLALIDATRQSLFEGVKAAVAGNRTGDVGHAIQRYCESRGYGVVRDLVGHGVGLALHEAPNVPNHGRRGFGVKLKPGMTLCIEPMINGGTREVGTDDDGWTVRTADGAPSAHFEHMVLVRRGRAEILSSWEAIEAAFADPRSAPVSPADAAPQLT